MIVQKGCEFIKQAVDKDNAEEHEKATSLYTKGLQSVIKAKVQKYLSKTEEIKV